MSKAKKVIYYILLVLVSAVFIMAGASKLFSNAQAIQGFQVAGLPVWLMYVVGAVEVLGVIGIWTKKFRVWAATGLFVVLLGATVVTAAYVSVPEALFPLLTAVVLYFILRLGKQKDAIAVTA
ncbi:MAG TPA: DoxX family protein [Candidatus Paceibacterota bacterium]|nr:DoxX family protein [Candidatus Paceibacterota bacterium]